ncbi:MAG TPA: maleylacetate reductase [Xanthobacteraceae bacterium]
MTAFIQDAAPQRVVFARGAIERIGDEVARLGLNRVLVIATPGSGGRLGARIRDLLGARAARLHAEAVVHVPRAIAEAGVAAARDSRADGLVAVGGGAAIGLAKAIAMQLPLPILAVPTTYSGSEATPLFGTTDGDRKITGSDARVVPRTIVYDPDLTLGLPAAVSAASGMNAMAHAVEALWVANRTPANVALASEALRRFAVYLPRVVTDGTNRDAREQCLIASWLAGTVLTGGTALHHKLAHVLGGLGLPHAETHAILLPHVTRFNIQAAPDAARRMREVLPNDDAALALARMLADFPIPQRLRDVGFQKEKMDFVADEIVKMNVVAPRAATAGDVRALLAAAY